MILTVDQKEQRIAAFESYCSRSQTDELEAYRKAVEMCVLAGFLNRDKFNQSLSFVSDGKYGDKK